MFFAVFTMCCSSTKFDMMSEGVSTSPIKLISGASPFCQTFFDNVKVPKENLVGELNDGWRIAKRLLQHERAAISNIGSRFSSKPENLEDAIGAPIGMRVTYIRMHRNF